MRYHVVYYGPDVSNMPPERIARVKTKDAARTVIRQRIGGRRFGRWTDDDGNECWHESLEHGCGGYCIEPVSE